MSFSGAGTLYLRAVRLTKLDAAGAPLVGADNAYVSNQSVQIATGLEYEEGEEVVQKNGSGIVCVSYRAPDTLKRGTISGFRWCTPDPNVLAFLQGGTVLEDEATPAAQLGYQAPAVGVDPLPNGVAIEGWTNAVVDGAVHPTLPFFHWVWSRARVRLSENMTLAAGEAGLPEFSGFSEQNVNFGDGPLNDIAFPTDRVWQYHQVATAPTADPGFVAVIADAP